MLILPRYSSEDHSPVSKYILKPFYQTFSAIFPAWMAPNLVTLTGLFFVLINFFTMLYYNARLDTECPRWVYLSYAIGLFLYQTFDACDGIQARKTGQSGPLGELFDHCVDALNTTLEVLLFASSVNMGYGWYLVASQFGTLCNFYLSTWEEYNTGTLYLSTFSGPVEGILIVIGLYIVTFFYGPSLWHTPVLDLLSIQIVDLPEYIAKANLIDYYMVFAVNALGMNIYQALVNVHKSTLKKGLPFGPAFRGVVPFVAFYVALITWIYLSPSIMYDHLLPLAFATGISFAFTVGRIILAHVTQQAFPMWNPLLLLPFAGIFTVFLGQYLEWDPELTGICSVWAGLGIALGVYGSFIAEIIFEITSYLDIGCLYIKHPISQTEKSK